MSSYVLKIIGVITMLIDHTGDAIVGHFSYLNLIGRIAFPIFAYQAVLGYMHTKDLKRIFVKMNLVNLQLETLYTITIENLMKKQGVISFFQFFIIQTQKR